MCVCVYIVREIEHCVYTCKGHRSLRNHSPISTCEQIPVNVTESSLWGLLTKTTLGLKPVSSLGPDVLPAYIYRNELANESIVIS